MTKKHQLVYGTDPEFFAGYEKNGKLFVLPPAYFREYLGVPYAPDIKHPVFLNAMKEMGVLIMEDGVAFEETVLPSTNWKDLFERVNAGKKLLSDLILSKFPNDCLPETITVPTINYDVDRWKNHQNREMEMCFIFGCDADEDAEDRLYNSPIINALEHPFRYGGGHIHVSGSKAIKDEPILAIQSLKLTAGLAAVAFSDTPDLDKARTYLYGRPAKYRVQKYKSKFNDIPFTQSGIEYRTPSNRWTNSLEHATQLFKWVEIGIRNLLEGKLALELIPAIGNVASQAIVDCDQKTAHELLNYVENKL